MPSVLEGVRVLDFGQYIAGPFCSAMLADFGAEVIRVEKVNGSEDRFVNPMAGTDGGGTFLQVNRNKLGIALNPKKPTGKAIVEKLVRSADIVVANLPDAELLPMGIDYESLKAIKPDIILTSVSAYGKGGPYSDRVGFDGIGQVMSGLAFMTGPVDGAPHRFSGAWVDFLTAMTCFSGTLAALIHRARTGEGQLVEGALLKSALTVAGGTLIEQALLKTNRTREGNRAQTAGPSDIVKAKDGEWVYVTMLGNIQFKRWCAVAGHPEWAEDPRFADDHGRGEHRQILCGRLADWASQFTADELLEKLASAKVVGAKVLSPQQVLDDPHVNAIGFLKRMPYPGTRGSAPIAQTHFSMSATPGVVARRAPLLGEHTDDVLRRLGYTDADLARLAQERVIGRPSSSKL